MAIDEKKLVEDLNECAREMYLKVCNPEMYGAGFYTGMTKALDIIEAQPKLDVPDTNVGKWIPVTERLPKQNEHIIGTFKNINEGSNLVFGVNFYHDLLNEPMPLIAWMPLPPAYQGE